MRVRHVVLLLLLACSVPLVSPGHAAASWQSTATWQTISVVNTAGVPAAQLARAEAAITAQSFVLSRYWHTPWVYFGAPTPGSWTLQIVRGAITGCPGQIGCHNAAPSAAVEVVRHAWAVADGKLIPASGSWTVTFSHEVMEMLVDPQLGGPEVCDPVELSNYRVNGVWLSDFALPAQFGLGTGARDYLGVLH